MSDEERIRIRFELTDECGNNYISETNGEVFRDLDKNDIDIIGRQLNIFLKQCGYYRKNDYIFMESVTEEEYDAIAEFLNELRNRKVDENDD